MTPAILSYYISEGGRNTVEQTDLIIMITIISRKFENIYIGWGLKYSARSFNPSLPPAVQDEFPIGADIVETTDPTAEQERALQAAQEEAQVEEEEAEEESDDD